MSLLGCGLAMLGSTLVTPWPGSGALLCRCLALYDLACFVLGFVVVQKFFVGIYLRECPNGQNYFEKRLQCPYGLAIMRVVKSERTSHHIEKGQAMNTNTYNKRAAYSLCSIEEAKKVSETFGGTTWYHEGGKTFAIGTSWEIVSASGKWLGNFDNEAEAIEKAQRMSNVHVKRTTSVYLVIDSDDPEDDELISYNCVTIYEKR